MSTTRLLHVPEVTVEFDPTVLRRVWLRRHVGSSWVLSIGGRQAWRGRRHQQRKQKAAMEGLQRRCDKLAEEAKCRP